MIDDINSENTDKIKDSDRINIEKEMENSFLRLCNECHCI